PSVCETMHHPVDADGLLQRRCVRDVLVAVGRRAVQLLVPLCDLASAAHPQPLELSCAERKFEYELRVARAFGKALHEAIPLISGELEAAALAFCRMVRARAGVGSFWSRPASPLS